MYCSKPGFPVLHCHLELVQTCPLSRYFRDESVEFSMVSAKVRHTFPDMRGTDEASVDAFTDYSRVKDLKSVRAGF